jgi:hypothetical protein
MNKIRLLFSSYVLVIIGLFFYSFTQVDLSLTLSKFSIYQTLEKQFQSIGFFQRPLSFEIFVSIISLLLFFYIYFLYLAKKQQFSLKNLKILSFLTFIILVFSYNAFSYDLFNYIFDAKILTFYHQNPYFHTPLDFTNDPMLNFMRWTHRFYPYGPSWLILTVPISFIGLNVFLPTFFMFKILMGLSFLGSAYLIYKISENLFPKEKFLNTVFFVFNPLVIIEGLVSAHNDFPMIFFALLSIYLYLQKKKVYSYISLIFSAGVKYSTGVLVPVLIVVEYFEMKKRKVNWEIVFLSFVFLSIAAMVFASLRTTFQPWYLMVSITFGALIAKKYYVFIPTIIATVFCLLIYGVYVYMSDYAKGYPQIIANIEWIGLISVLLITGVFFLNKRMILKH